MEEPEVHSHHHGGHSGHRWFDITASVCAMVVSFASLYLAIHHGHVMQEMAEANARMVTATSWPQVSYSTSNTDVTGQFTRLRFSLTNKGVGPARIEGMEVSYEGKPVQSVQDLLKTCCSTGGKPSGLAWRLSTANGEILRPGEEKDFLQLDKSANEELWARVNDLPGKVTVKACYCSVFDECWVTDSRAKKAAKVKACPTDWAQYGD
ncbi:hypothetical protein ACS5PN_02755 [Roseateles sp. NT4]|uniref:hypothetical protein n=1 Tax=Roseateles sp. NT4 TaxID=3453715 RepID=UPI003EEF992F